MGAQGESPGRRQGCESGRLFSLRIHMVTLHITSCLCSHPELRCSRFWVYVIRKDIALYWYKYRSGLNRLSHKNESSAGNTDSERGPKVV